MCNHNLNHALKILLILDKKNKSEEFVSQAASFQTCYSLAAHNRNCTANCYRTGRTRTWWNSPDNLQLHSATIRSFCFFKKLSPTAHHPPKKGGRWCGTRQKNTQKSHVNYLSEYFLVQNGNSVHFNVHHQHLQHHQQHHHQHQRIYQNILKTFERKFKIPSALCSKYFSLLLLNEIYSIFNRSAHIFYCITYRASKSNTMCCPHSITLYIKKCNLFVCVR